MFIVLSVDPCTFNAHVLLCLCLFLCLCSRAACAYAVVQAINNTTGDEEEEDQEDEGEDSVPLKPKRNPIRRGGRSRAEKSEAKKLRRKQSKEKAGVPGFSCTVEERHMLEYSSVGWWLDF